MTRDTASVLAHLGLRQALDAAEKLRVVLADPEGTMADPADTDSALPYYRAVGVCRVWSSSLDHALSELVLALEVLTLDASEAEAGADDLEAL